MVNYDDFSKKAIEAAITASLGREANVVPHNLSDPTVLTKALQNLTHEIGDIFRVFWVERAPASVFCLSGFEPTPIVCSTSYLSLAAEVRRLFSDSSYKGELRGLVAQQTIYRILAEMSLLHGDPDLGALFLARGESITKITFTDHSVDWHERWRELETMPISEATMMLWMGPIFHEIGHSVAADGKVEQLDAAVGPDVIRDAFNYTVQKFPYPDEIKEQMLIAFEDSDSGSCLSMPHLMEEARADLFALLALLPATQHAMDDPEIGGDSPVAFFWEFMVFFNCITLVDRCRNVAIAAAMNEVNHSKVMENLIFRPVAHATRSLLLETQLGRPEFYINPDVSNFDRHADELTAGFDAAKEEVVEVVAMLDEAVGTTTDFALFHDRRPSEPAIFAAFRDARQGPVDSTFSAASAFFDMAQSLDKVTPFVRELQKIQRAPKAPLTITTDSLVPFVIHGYKIAGTFVPITFTMGQKNALFIFHPESEAEQLFAAHNQSKMAIGEKLIRMTILAHRWERVVPTLREQIVFEEVSAMAEGTSTFADHFDALKSARAEAGL